MLFNNLAATILAASALLVPTAMGQDAPSLAPRSLDMTVKWHSRTTCSDKGGPERSYSRDVCMPLTDTNHGVEIIDRLESCRSK